MNEKGRQMRLSNGVELCPAVFQMVCHLKVLQSHLGQIIFYNQEFILSAFSFYFSCQLRQTLLREDFQNQKRLRMRRTHTSEGLIKYKMYADSTGWLQGVMENLIGNGKRELTTEGFTQNI